MAQYVIENVGSQSIGYTYAICKNCRDAFDRVSTTEPTAPRHYLCLHELHPNVLALGSSGVDVRLPLNAPLLRLRALSSRLQHYPCPGPPHPAFITHPY